MRGLRLWPLLCVIPVLSHLAVAQRNTWIATWTAAPDSSRPEPDEQLLKIEDQTVRERMRLSVGGDQIRIRLSNEYGSAPLFVGSVTVALPTDPMSVRPGSIRAVTFAGRNSVTIPAGTPILSDPVAISLNDETEISISLYFPKRVATPTLHLFALKRAVISRHGDYTHAEKIEGATSDASILVSAILVPARPHQRLIVAFGDSLTDGAMSTIDGDRTWPSDFIRRLGQTSEGSSIAVVNAGIAGNRLLSDGFGISALARFDRDALMQPGVTHIVLLEGINDIGFPGAKEDGKYLANPADARSSEDLIDAYRQLIARAHVHGVKVIGATIAPFEGVEVAGYYSESKDAVRQEVNKWIRTSGSFDDVIDFDSTLRDPDHPSRLLPRFASQDRLHLNDIGYQAMADAIDLAYLK
jgi:lysophospholipase L1-like esterase